nr:hypothetical protein [Nocardia farcinica]
MTACSTVANRISTVGDGLVRHGLEVAAEDRQGAGADGGLRDLAGHRELLTPVRVDQDRAEEADVAGGECGDQAEPLHRVVAGAVQVHQVAAAAASRGALDDEHVPAVPVQAQGGGESGHARPDHDHPPLPGVAVVGRVVVGHGWAPFVSLRLRPVERCVNL